MNLFLQQERTDNTRFSPRRHTKHARHTHIQHTQTLRSLSKCCALGHNFGAGATKCRLLLSQPYLKDTTYYMLCTQKVRGEGVLKLYHSFQKQQAQTKLNIRSKKDVKITCHLQLAHKCCRQIFIIKRANGYLSYKGKKMSPLKAQTRRRQVKDIRAQKRNPNKNKLYLECRSSTAQTIVETCSSHLGVVGQTRNAQFTIVSNKDNQCTLSKCSK